MGQFMGVGVVSLINRAVLSRRWQIDAAQKVGEVLQFQPKLKPMFWVLSHVLAVQWIRP